MVVFFVKHVPLMSYWACHSGTHRPRENISCGAFHPQSRQSAKLFLQNFRRNFVTPPLPHPQCPRFGSGQGAHSHSLGGEGVGESQFRGGDLHCGTFYILYRYMYFITE
jgi:hypothetical protein